MKMSREPLAASLAAAGLFAAGTSTMAQEAQGDSSISTDLTEIVVTAQKRVERIQDVPISITVANQAQLERQQVNTVSDLSRVAPSLEIQQAPNQSVGGGGQIRGIGTQSFQQGAVGSVGIVVDQVSQGNTNIADLFDISRVEVLKGPQGTLFGLTTSAGVINITTNAPAFDKFSARLRTELSDEGRAGSQFGQQVVQGVVNIPVSESSALRLSGNWTDRQGVDRNTITGDLDTHKSYGFRGRFLWDASDDLSVNLIADYTRSKEDGLEFFVIQKATPDLAAVLAQCGITASESNRDYCSTDLMGNEGKTYGTSAQIDYDAGPVTLTSVSSYRKQDVGPQYLNIFRLDPNALDINSGPTLYDSHLFTQEIRVASPNNATIEYTAGLFYSKQKTNNDPIPFTINLTLPFPPFPVIPVSALNGNVVGIDDESKAVFGQATLHAGNRLHFIAGARYTDETLDVPYQSLDGAMLSGRPNDTIHNFSWKAGPQFELSRDLMAFATVSRGYKGPQIALGDPSTAGNQPLIIRPEIPTSYEIGLKSSLLNGALLTDLSAFYLRLKDYQGQLCTPNANGGLSCAPQNIDRVISKGIELNVFGRPSDNLTLNTGVIYNPVEYPAGFVGQDGSALGGEQLQSAPKWKFTGSGEYSHALGASLQGFLAADAIYKSELRLAASTDPNVIFGDHWNLGGRLGLRGSDERWTVAIFGRNLSNRHEPALRFQNFPDGFIGSYGQLLTAQSFRQVGLSFDVRF